MTRKFYTVSEARRMILGMAAEHRKRSLYHRKLAHRWLAAAIVFALLAAASWIDLAFYLGEWIATPSGAP